MLFIFGAFTFPEKKLIGHWILMQGDLYEAGAGDTLVFIRKHKTAGMYEWGSGVSSGFEFLPNGDFLEYHNVLCSTESSPVMYSGERWSLNPEKDAEGARNPLGDILAITGSERNFTFKAIFSGRNKLQLIKR